MNEETSELIEKLAEKLGTTAEYLWNVIISQAPIYAINSILEIIATITFGVVLWKIHKRLSKETDSSGYGNTLYEKHEGLYVVPMVILLIIFLVLVLVAFFTFSNIITAILNPEYWALMEILNSCS